MATVWSPARPSNHDNCGLLRGAELSEVSASEHTSHERGHGTGELIELLSHDESKKARIADTVTQGGQVTINGTTNNLGTAEVYATATTSQGGEVPYQISMVRDGLGWKVSSVSLSFTSQS